MDGSETITVEEKAVNIREWRYRLSNEEVSVLIKRMDEDLKQAKSFMDNMPTFGAKGKLMATDKGRKLASMRIMQNGRED